MRQGYVALLMALGPAPALAQPLMTRLDAVSGIPKLDETTQTEEVRFKTGADDRMTVPVRLSGVGPFRFLVDTGADRTAISRQIAGRLGLVRGEPAGFAGAAEPRGDPPQLRDRVPLAAGARAGDRRPQRGPARLPVLPGDRELRVVQRGELPGRPPPLGLEFEVPQAGVLRQRAHTAHGLSVTARDAGSSMAEIAALEHPRPGDSRRAKEYENGRYTLLLRPGRVTIGSVPIAGTPENRGIKRRIFMSSPYQPYPQDPSGGYGQPPYPPQAGRGRRVHPQGQVLVGQRTVFLELFQDAQVQVVQLGQGKRRVLHGVLNN